MREDVAPRWPFFRLGPPSLDGLTRRRGAGLVRLLHVDGAPVVVAVSGTVFAARAATEVAAREGIARMRFATGVDDDLADFHARFRDDPLLGPALRARPWLRVRRNPTPWETLAWAVTEQLIDSARAIGIQKRLVAGHGPRFAGLRDSPDAATVATLAPAQIDGCGLHPKRTRALLRAAREVASGRVALTRASATAAKHVAAMGGRAAPPTGLAADAARGAASPARVATRAGRGAAPPTGRRAPAGRRVAPPPGLATAAAAPAGHLPLAATSPATGNPAGGDFERLLAIPGIGTWTVEMVALHGLGRLDVIPAGDLNYLKLAGRLSTGNPRAVADEDEVRGLFAPYAPYAGLAAQYLIRARTLPVPRRAGTRSSTAALRAAAG